MPKHWFAEPLTHAMKTVVRPPTKLSRRKELRIDMKIPREIFVDIMKPFETDELTGLKWTDAERTNLEPTKDRKTLEEFAYKINAPSKVDKFWRLHETEVVRNVRKEGRLQPTRRGLHSARLHLSNAAEERGERTDLLAQVTGNVDVLFKVPKKDRAMPSLHITLKVSTLAASGHIEWATNFSAKTAAALRKQMETHLRSMIESPEYPTLTTTLQLVATEAIRPEPTQRALLMPPASASE